jgi:hypothetical protein
MDSKRKSDFSKTNGSDSHVAFLKPLKSVMVRAASFCMTFILELAKHGQAKDINSV